MFSGRGAIGSDNAMTKDHPRLKRTTKLNVAKVLLHSAIIIIHSSSALKPLTRVSFYCNV